jgi:hypothetical protein
VSALSTKRPLFGLCLIGLAIAVWPGSAFGSIASEERQGQQVLDAVNRGSRSCSELSRDEFEVVGDYVMGRMVGSTQAHEQMDALMDRMMGARANQQMHVAMGERFTRCGRGSVPSSFGSMMGAMGMMGGYAAGGTAAGSGGMMGNPFTSTQSSDGDNDFGTAGWVMVAMMALLLVIAGVAVWLLRPSRRGSSASPLDILQARYARGEIDAEEYDRGRRALGGMT